MLPPLDVQIGHLVLPFCMPLEVRCTICDVIAVLALQSLGQMDGVQVESKPIEGWTINEISFAVKRQRTVMQVNFY